MQPELLDLNLPLILEGHLSDRFWLIVLKKSAMVCASEKYVSEIEVFTFGRGFRTRFSRSSVQKRRFHQSMIRQFGQTDFFNTIGQNQSFRCTHAS